MTRLALACTGIGWTLGILTVALTGPSCIALSFSAGIAFASGVWIVALLGLWWVGKGMGWWVRIPNEHSQSGGE